jgi:ribulose-phosphate 3-epimerase
MAKISASLFQFESKDELLKAIKASSNVDFYHIDVTDGIFVKDKYGGASFFHDESKLRIVQEASVVPLDVHLMIANPLDHIERYARFRPAYITFHVEAAHQAKQKPEDIIQKIRSYGIKAGIALNPQTQPRFFWEYASKVDLVLFMSVVPGKGGQGYIPFVTRRIKRMKERINHEGLDTLIEVDGGIKLDNISVPVTVGADIIVSGTGIYSPKGQYENYSPSKMIEEMKKVGAH